jgi:phage gp29-like protein
MADEAVVPPLPPPGEIVTQQALYATQISLYRNTLAFGGVRNPSNIWSSMLRDDGTAILYYRELEEKDTDVANALDTLKEAVLERDYDIQPFDDTPLAAEIATFIKQQLANVSNLDGIVDNMLDAAGYGFSVSEMQFDVSMGQANLIDIKDCPQELFLFGDRFQPQIGQLQFLTQPQASSGQPVPEEKFLIYSYRPRSRNRMGRPLLRSIFWASWFKRNMQRLWVQYAEKGPGTAVVRYQDSNDPQAKQTAADLAQALIEEVAVGVPEGFEYDKELLTIARALNPAVYKDFFEAMQKEIVRRILGETLTSFGGDGGKGTQALGNVHADTLETKAIRLCKATQSVINRQLIRPLVLWNYGPNAPMPSWVYDTEEQEDLTERLGIDRGVQGMGLELSKSYLRERYAVPAPGKDDEIAIPSATGAPAVTIAENTRATFAEPVHEAQATVDMQQFDALTQQLRDESIGLFRTRIQQIADASKPVEH